MPLIRVNCAAIPDTLLESELFGHVRGAFTGAVANKKGRFALAHGGTILLDEIATLGAPLQAKLLRVLQEREFEPLGSERTERVDVRVIAATNRDLRQLVADGKFQEDLFYRLNVIPIEIPPLRERREDIPVLVEHFLRKHAQRTGKRIERVEEGVAAAMQQYDWPGNVRELENTIHRAVLLATGDEIGVEAIRLPDGSRIGEARGPAEHAAAVAGQIASAFVGRTVADVERDLILETLRHCLGNRTHAAKILGVSIRTLRNKLNEYSDAGMNIPAPGGGGEMRGAA
jgi:two-component system response regulator FlrC